MAARQGVHAAQTSQATRETPARDPPRARHKKAAGRAPVHGCGGKGQQAHAEREARHFLRRRRVSTRQ